MKEITVVGHYGMSLLMDVRRFAEVGETAEGLGLEYEPGGKGFNQALAASRLGATVNFITAVGDDDFGGQCKGDLEKEGIAGQYIMQFPGQKTACAFVINSADKKSEVYVYPGAIRSVSPEDIETYRDVIWGSSLMLLQNEVNAQALERVIQIAGEKRIPIVYNPAPAREMPEEIFQHINVITPNETEAALLTGQDPGQPLDVDKAFARLKKLGVENIIITMGENGSQLLLGETRYAVAPFRGDVVSTTGAGDCFNAALATHYLATGELMAAAEYATIAAGVQVTRPGVIANMPYQAEIDALYKRLKNTFACKI